MQGSTESVSIHPANHHRSRRFSDRGITHKRKKFVRRLGPGTNFLFFNQEEKLLKNLVAGRSDPAGQFLFLVIFDLGQNVHPRGDTLAGAIGIPDGAERHGFYFLLQD